MRPQIQVVEVDARERDLPRYRFPQHGRAYMSPTVREYNSKPQIYVHPKGESIFENLCFRHDRPHQVYRQAIPAALEALELPPGIKVRWSQKAGCSCGCSPGFIVQVEGVHKDCWVTIDGVEQPVTNRALDRAAQVAADPTLAGSLGVAAR